MYIYIYIYIYIPLYIYIQGITHKFQEDNILKDLGKIV